MEHGSLFMALTIIAFIAPRECQITVLGTTEVKPKQRWSEKLHYFPMIGKTYYFQYDIFIKGWQSAKVAAVQLQPSIVRTYIHHSHYQYNIKGATAKSVKNFPGLNYQQEAKWLTVTAWFQIFGDKYSAGVVMGGQADSQNEITTAEEIKDANIELTHAGYHNNYPHCTVRSISVFGPQRVNLQVPVVNPDVTPQQIVISTEFHSSGEDSYEIFPFDNVAEPLEMTTSLSFDISGLTHENVKKDVVLEERLNEFGMAVGLKHKTFTKFNVTESQSYTLPVIFGNAHGRRIHLAYIHTNQEYDLIDVNSQVVESLVKNCGDPDFAVSFTASRVRSSTNLDIRMAPPKKNCNDDIHDITFLVHHKKNLVPFRVEKADVECMKATSIKIHKHYVQIHFAKLFIGAKICTLIQYDVPTDMDVSELLEGVIETKYKTATDGVYKTKTVKRKFNGHLEEFPGYYIKNLDKGCCVAIKGPQLYLTCTMDTSKCLRVKQKNNAFVTEKGCFQIINKEAHVKLAPCDYDNRKQVVQWDKTDITFPAISTKDSKGGNIFLKIGDALDVEVIKAKRRYRFRQILINSQARPVQCYMKDVLLKGVTMATIDNIASWEICRVKCRSQRACVAWTWFSPHHHNTTLRLKCVLKSLVTSERGMVKRFVSGCISGYHTCVGKVAKSSTTTIPADVSVLELNNKLYFCTYIRNDIRSACYRHEVDRYAVTKMDSSMVSVLGGHRYSNTIYGHDPRGQVIKLNKQDASFTLVSKSAFDGISSKDFVRAKSYNRTKLFYEALYGEFLIHGERYGITYYGIYHETRKTHLVVWLPEAECNQRVASREALALTSCAEVDSYCEHSVNGFYWLRKPLPFNITQVWCDFKEKEERYTVIEEESIQVGNEPITQLPNLSKEYRIEFQLNIDEVVPREGGKEHANIIVEILSEKNDLLLSFMVKTDKDILINKLHAFSFAFAKQDPTSASKSEFSAEQIPLLLDMAWNDIKIVKWYVEKDKSYMFNAFLNNKKVADGKLEDSPAFNNVTITSGYRADAKFFVPNNAFIRNFYVHMKCEKDL